MATAYRRSSPTVNLFVRHYTSPFGVHAPDLSRYLPPAGSPADRRGIYLASTGVDGGFVEPREGARPPRRRGDRLGALALLSRRRAVMISRFLSRRALLADRFLYATPDRQY